MKQKTISELMNLGGKTAIVTGGAMGIGLGIASRLAEAGANVLIADLDEKEGEKSADGKRVKFLKTDVSQEDDIKKMIETAVKEFGSLDIIVNNAGIYPQKPVSQMTKEDFDKVMSVNLRSVFLCTREASNQMISQGKGGKIINITSIDALHPSMIGLAHYDASKHGVWGFTKNSALELAEHKIWVNAIAPGGIATPGIAKMSPAGANMEKFLEVFLAKIPMRRMGDPDDIGKVALFLASDLASYMTGSQIVVDGGVLLS
ncbi:SDR family oxidoreductase [Candidatus Giovannonibacteria bacterium RIFCSPLOWO2_02_FULL_43_11b]|uniref:SDR family oxidoreductase n=1 Tax=Candidatus Giovannonibacteria bacterium RIFCSPHIGHO2_12_FULL_43_15 TaxID=1798341 RepID=A0A1F5WNI0_9BACT|nr:MAG: SDR family oxidoreductase [Candidatus Giovannonibacteria bacterium RIFCSPHIGHO2_02_FULL_43_32]OGF77213.1 MAG: SDR family oxidoreductase [Candidatus Giovannonibacteria bacterium RIFCSPHIGHO2_12_FULL_43_15]OGF90585.1 MAG: SDR family oxidoreductase [Candidatus Giovannonibacteria bacterium RIFCSPLOWO2_02_FULL_43_11b]OGF92246.1 MAG: SDR family oxidoreductase [Candidatus Giovannonibacteria bacterium RIFCSPLOWO2_12_FULL_43_11c]